jgi:alkanesulfonate monooxygenase SsuD/methylene tetrahydromethanopterin reductase-like flavin-dependent oxidoreductase (luciferase family)
VNIWPRPWQQPHPPVWSTTGSTQTARKLGGYGYVMATLGTGYDTRRLYNAYRQGYAETNHGAAAPADRFAYLGLMAVGRTEAEARRRGELIASYPRSSGIVFAPFRNPPGYLSIEDNVRMLKGEGRPRSYTKDGRVVDMAKGSVQDLIDAGVMFCGTPDQVYDQIADFVDHCGGMGNLLMMGHAGPMSHEDTVENLTLFAQEVYPRLKELRQPDPVAVAAQ